MSRVAFTDLRRFTTIDSTNRYLVDEARAGAPEGVVAVAEFQTAGRGRLGRRWEAPPGACLLVSVLLRPELDPGDFHSCTTLVALAAVDACTSVAGVEPRIKWPNDLVAGDRKLAGVLAEVVVGGAGEPSAVVVGIGINVSWGGPLGAGGTSLDALTGGAVDGEALLDAVLDSLAARREALDTVAGRKSLAAEARTRCATLGQQVRVDLAHAEVEGTAVDLTDDGHLVVEEPDGTRRSISTGDVVHLRPSTPSSLDAEPAEGENPAK